MTQSTTALPSIDTPKPPQRMRRLLDPIDRSSEVLFALIMVVAITGSISVAEAGRKEIHTMLVGALGCNLAWGIVDAVMYLMAGLTERARSLRTLRQLQNTSDPDAGRRIIAAALPPVVRSVLEPAELETIRTRILQVPAPEYVRLRREDWLGALAVCLLVFITTLPVVIPFVLLDDAAHALHVSNAIAIIMLYAAGHSLGSYAGSRPWLTGLSMVLVGIALVATTIALGG